VKATFAPAPANLMATAFPIPFDAPVISAVFPWSNFMLDMLNERMANCLQCGQK
jgi:hypothetical protein